MQTNYEKGRNAEYYVINILEKRGYKCVRSAGSHTPIDILAAKGKSLASKKDTPILKGHNYIRENEALNAVLAVQVKASEENKMTLEEKFKLIEWARLFNAVPIEASKVDGRWSFRHVSLDTTFYL